MILKNKSIVVNYILQFLLQDYGVNVESVISYCKNSTGSLLTPITIIDSRFFDEGVYGTKEFSPVLPLKEIEGIPLLFGEDRIERMNGQIIIHADFIASTYFLITRYEELIRTDIRDQFGRFLGKESLPYRAGFIDRPIVDEYGKLLRRFVREAGINVAEPPNGFSNIYLTHDIDVPWEHFTAFTAVKRVLGNLKREHRLNFYPIRNFVGDPTRDPGYTFEHIIRTDQTVPSAKSIYFVKSGGKKRLEDSHIYIYSKACKRLMRMLSESGAILGYHVSYEAGVNTDLILSEVETLRSVLNREVNYSRNHYLLSREPADFNVLISAGLTDDFTMGYADVAGFRLGTCHAVRWINPVNGILTSLVLHPLTIMDGTLSSPNYMNLDEQASQEYGKKLLFETHVHNGEVTLLWHNNGDVGKPTSEDWNNYVAFLMYSKKINIRK